MNRILKNLLTRISLSRCIAELEDLDRLYLERCFDEYTDKFSHFLLVLKSHRHIVSSDLSTVSINYDEYIRSIEESIRHQNIEELRDQSAVLSSIFNSEYSSSNVRHANTTRRFSFLLPVLLALALLAFAIKPLKEKYNREVVGMDLLKNGEVYASKTISDVLQLKKALQQYFEDNKQYPGTSGTWYGVVSPFGEAKADWIPGLAPKYIRTLPNDPRKYRQPIEQYMYQSNGKDFKLIAHFPVGMDAAIKQYPELVDPRRSSWAIGCWSEGAKNW